MLELSKAAILALSVLIPTEASATAYIKNDMGGSYVLYEQQIKYYSKSNKSIVISGKCASACTMYTMKKYNLNVCMRPNTKFGFHQPFVAGNRNPSPDVLKQIKLASKIMFDSYHPKIQKYLKANGWPSYHDGDNSRKMTWMSAKDIEGVIPYCGDNK